MAERRGAGGLHRRDRSADQYGNADQAQRLPSCARTPLRVGSSSVTGDEGPPLESSRTRSGGCAMNGSPGSGRGGSIALDGVAENVELGRAINGKRFAGTPSGPHRHCCSRGAGDRLGRAVRRHRSAAGGRTQPHARRASGVQVDDQFVVPTSPSRAATKARSDDARTSQLSVSELSLGEAGGRVHQGRRYRDFDAFSTDEVCRAIYCSLQRQEGRTIRCCSVARSSPEPASNSLSRRRICCKASAASSSRCATPGSMLDEDEAGAAAGQRLADSLIGSIVYFARLAARRRSRERIRPERPRCSDLSTPTSPVKRRRRQGRCALVIATVLTAERPSTCGCRGDHRAATDDSMHWVCPTTRRWRCWTAGRTPMREACARRGA